MPSQIDFNEVIRRAVSDEVQRVMTPYMDVLERLANAFGGAAPARKAAPAARAAAAPAVRARRGPGRPRRAGGGGGKGDASKFSVGQAVRYKQGRGEFTATVVATDPGTNMVTVKREKDGKEVQRPAAKVY